MNRPVAKADGKRGACAPDELAVDVAAHLRGAEIMLDGRRLVRAPDALARVVRRETGAITAISHSATMMMKPSDGLLLPQEQFQTAVHARASRMRGSTKP